MAKMLTQVQIAGVNVEAELTNYKVVDVYGKEISSVELIFRKPVFNLVEFTEGNTIDIWRGFTTPTDEKIFSGLIIRIDREGLVITVTAADNLLKAKNSETTRTFFDTDAEAGKLSEIFKVLADNSGLSYSATTVQDSGTVDILTRFVCNHARNFDKMKELADALDWQFYYRADTDKIYFEPRGFELNTTVLQPGVNVITTPKWKDDIAPMLKWGNNITIIGSRQEVETTENFTGDGSTTTFTLTKTPLSVKVFVNETLKTGGVPNSTESFDYQVDRENKNIIFETAPVTGTTVATTTVLSQGVLTGSASDTHADDGVRLEVAEVAGDGLCIDLVFTVPLDGEATEVDTNGYYAGSASHWVDIYAFNYRTNVWDLLTDQDGRIDNQASDQDYNNKLSADHTNTSDGAVKIRFWHNETTYNNAHDLFLDFVQLTYATNIEVRYSYGEPTPVTGKMQESIDNFFEVVQTFWKLDVLNTTDAERLLNKFLDYGIPFQIVTTEVRLLTTGVRVGQSFRVNDVLNDKDETLVLEKYTIRYPNDRDFMTLSDKPVRSEETDVELMNRVRRLEEDNLKNEDVLINVVAVGVNMGFIRFNLKVVTGEVSGFVLGHPTLGKLGKGFTPQPTLGSVRVLTTEVDTDYFTSTEKNVGVSMAYKRDTLTIRSREIQNSFVLGHPTFGKLGKGLSPQPKLGSSRTAWVEEFAVTY